MLYAVSETYFKGIFAVVVYVKLECNRIGIIKLSQILRTGQECDTDIVHFTFEIELRAIFAARYKLLIVAEVNSTVIVTIDNTEHFLFRFEVENKSFVRFRRLRNGA